MTSALARLFILLDCYDVSFTRNHIHTVR